ncbi:tRNA (adenine(58)-N(1))-methyltransferase non-catalytic subunit TRM6 isoform X2 [Anabrus simplex]|uniref:tRNA (adenine(58)-N(1))-methyltransferase non-catalytic subunit TRM6 isoform X2 n=1 Tax=Anabrus simplex TaxID=316456 RepID=UPI0035A2D5A4
MSQISPVMCDPEKGDTVKVGDYIVIQRQSYMKLLRVKQNGSVMLGKDQLKLDAIVNRPFFTTYKMEPRKPSKRDFILTECDSAVSLAEQLSESLSGGIDNRNISDDGNSQLLSTEDIVGMRDSGMAGHEIVGQLIENSKTFKNKTEYSQVKYLKKKEKKYFEYITVRRPTMRLVSEILYRQDPSKILGIRMDTLAQLTTAAGITTQGTYILYESGCLGLVAASLLNCLDEGGSLIHAVPGNLPQRQAINSMNFNESQLSRLISVNIYSLLRKLLQDGDSGPGQAETSDGKYSDSEENILDNTNCCVTDENGPVKSDTNSDTKETGSVSEIENMVVDEETSKKRKHPEEEESSAKKARWEVETQRAADLLKAHPVDGLVVVAKEDPANILTTLLKFVAISRPFVVYSLIREPLMDLYVQLKCRSDVTALRLTESWLRTHQILPNRTHPDILTSGGGGYLLSGTVVDGAFLSLNER